VAREARHYRHYSGNAALQSIGSALNQPMNNHTPSNHPKQQKKPLPQPRRNLSPVQFLNLAIHTPKPQPH
jgi:hypothetical protein